MPKLIYLFVACLCAASAFAVDVHDVTDSTTVASSKNIEPDSKQMEKELQRLPWKKFRSVILSVPKLKAGVEAYGPIGWQYVQANYTTYGWKKQIDKLDLPQKAHLAKLIKIAKGAR